jgi:hypothetical protein
MAYVNLENNTKQCGQAEKLEAYVRAEMEVYAEAARSDS